MRNFRNNDRSRRSRDGRDSDQRDSSRSRMHDAVCDDCGDNCKLPFRPSSGKPVYCSNCFEKRGNGNGASRRPSFSRNRNSRRPNFSGRDSRPQKNYDKQFEIVNDKLNKILRLLSPEGEVAEAKTETIAEKVTEAKTETIAEEKTV